LEGERLGMETRRTPLRVNVSMGLVLVSLVAEVVFVALLGYGLYRFISLVR
jgi:hypothetical protein